MTKKSQLFITAAISAAIVVLIGTVALSLVGLYLFASTAEAQTNAVPAANVEAQPVPVAISEVQPVSAAPRTITVVGEGKMRVAPDIAQANIGVEVIESDVKEASSKAAEIMENLLATLKAQGVAENDIQTSYYNVWIERPYNPQGQPGTEVLYHVNNNVMVTIRELDKVTPILGAAIEAGANSINSVSFNVADPSLLRSEIREKAVANALAEAQELAELNGVELGEVASVSEVISSGAYYVSELSAADQAGMGGGAGPISPGQVELSVQLEVSYAIQ